MWDQEASPNCHSTLNLHLSYRHPQQKYSSKNLENYTLSENVHSRKGRHWVSNPTSFPTMAIWQNCWHLMHWVFCSNRSQGRLLYWFMLCEPSLCPFSQQKYHLFLNHSSVHRPDYAWKKRNLVWERKGFLCFSCITIKQNLILHGARIRLSFW